MRDLVTHKVEKTEVLKYLFAFVFIFKCSIIECPRDKGRDGRMKSSPL